jgi:arylformamidase
MGRIIDITVAITKDLAVWPGDPQVSLERISKIEDGEIANMSQVRMSVHTGTHVDAPYHFIAAGKTVESLPLEVLIGPVQVVHLDDGVTVIDAGVVNDCGIAPGTERVLFKTRNSRFWPSESENFHTEYTAVGESGARELLTLGVRLVGIDYLSIAPFKLGKPTHEVLLGSGVVVLEGCDLSQIDAGTYTLCALPTKFSGSDGAPVRAILIKD